MAFVQLCGRYGHLHTIVDEEDLTLANQFRWFYHRIDRVVYARRTIVIGERRTYQFLHSFLTGWDRVDHVNHDGLDNRRLNLRHVTQAENARNLRKRTAPCSSQFKGVCKERNSWHAYINVGGKRHNLGFYPDEVEAALAYDRAAPSLHGEFASLNFPEGT